MLSVIATFVETLRLVGRYFGFIFALSLLNIPGLWLTSLIPTAPHPSAENVMLELVLALVSIVLAFVVNGVKISALLGVLSRSPGVGLQSAALNTVRDYFWPVFRLQIALLIIGLLLGIPFGAIMSLFIIAGPGNAWGVQLMVVVFAIICLVFLKYALAYPLVVIEGSGAWNSLSGSWRMTRGRFMYVLGCYVFLGTLQYGLGQFWSKIATMTGDRWPQWAGGYTEALLDSVWVVLSWCMYCAIRNVSHKENAPWKPLHPMGPPQVD